MEKVVLITGAAQGLGRALAEEFLSHGWQVIATDRNDLLMAGLLDHERATIFNMDITSIASVNQVFEQVSNRGIIIDLIINNAGIDRYFPLAETPVELFKDVFEVNVFGGYRVNQTFLPVLRKPGGRIVHISSESLNLTLPFMPYPISKKLVECYARALRIELKFLGVDVVIVRPGAIRTALLGAVSGIQPASENLKLGKWFNNFAASASGEIGRTISAGEAAAFIYKVSQIPRPAPVYRINNMLKLKIAALVPFRILEKLVYRKLF